MSDRWIDFNQSFLVAQFAHLKRVLGFEGGEVEYPAQQSMESPAIERLSQLFGLSAFERHILLLTAGVEMDSTLAEQCRQAQGHPTRSNVTFGLAMATLSDPHWSALTPAGPLRRFRLVELEAGHGLTSAPLRIDERILHYLAGTAAPAQAFAARTGTLTFQFPTLAPGPHLARLQVDGVDSPVSVNWLASPPAFTGPFLTV